jgi:hypothetical protein
MTYIFFSDNKWFFHSGDLPVKPVKEEFASYLVYYPELFKWENAIADIKAKALEIANPEMLDQKFKEAFIEFIHNGIEFYQWPGTFEVKRLIDYQTPAFAHLVLPPEEKNMNEMYYLNGPDEFVNPNDNENRKTLSQEQIYALWVDYQWGLAAPEEYFQGLEHGFTGGIEWLLKKGYIEITEKGLNIEGREVPKPPQI